MKTKSLLILSLAVNVIAAALLVRNFTRHDVRSLPAAAERATATTDVSRVVRAEETRREARPETAHELARPAASGPLPNIWKQVAAADYQAFADNLRAIGVPEETVRDVVMLDLMKSLGEQMTGLSRHVEKPFWQAQTHGTKQPSVSNDVAQAMAQLTAFTKQVLGLEPGDWITDRWGWVVAIGNGYGPDSDFEPLQELFAGFENADQYFWMAPERARELQRMVAANEKAQEELEGRIEAIGDRRSPAFEALQFQLSQVIQAGEKIADNYLTPTERRERDLRDDYALQTQLAGVEVSRAEYERLHDLARSVGATEAPYFKPNTPEAAQAIGILGAERFAEFQRGADPQYGGLLSVCDAYEIPLPVARQIDDLRRDFLARVTAGEDRQAARQRAFGAMEALLPETVNAEIRTQVFGQYFPEQP